MSEEIVYGEFGKWIECEFCGKLMDGWRLGNRLLCLDVNLLIGYALFILSHVGYSLEKPKEPDKYGNSGILFHIFVKQRETPKEIEEWINFLCSEDIVYTMVTMFGNQEPRQETVERQDGFRLTIAAIPVHLDPELEMFGGKRAAEWKQHAVAEQSDGRINGGFFLIDPRIVEENGEGFQREKEIAKNLVGQDIYLSPEELAERYIPDRDRRFNFSAQWREIREKAIMELTADNPDVRLFLLRSMNEQEVLDIQRMLTLADIKTRSRKYKDAIRDCGEICERLFKFLYRKEYRGKDFWRLDKNLIENDFGTNILNDFKTVMNLRNDYSHASKKKPNRDETYEAISRTELIFKRFLVKSGRAKG